MKATERNRLVDAVNVNFSALGREGTTKPPRAKGNAASAEWEYWLAEHLHKLAKSRREAANRLAIYTGIIPDHDKNPLPAGTMKTIHEGEFIDVDVEVRQPTKRLDPKKLLDYLREHKVSVKLIAEAVEHATNETKAPHYFSGILLPRP